MAQRGPEHRITAVDEGSRNHRQICQINVTRGGQGICRQDRTRHWSQSEGVSPISVQGADLHLPRVSGIYANRHSAS